MGISNVQYRIFISQFSIRESGLSVSSSPKKLLRLTSMTYTGHFCERIANAFRKANIKIGFWTHSKLKTMLCTSVDNKQSKYKNFWSLHNSL